jgi:hypothetical protein
MENVSHNTSYSECSPNVKDVEEEFAEDTHPISVPPNQEIHLNIHEHHPSQPQLRAIFLNGNMMGDEEDYNPNEIYNNAHSS